MREVLKEHFSHFQSLLASDFIDGEIYVVTDDSHFRPNLTLNYSCIENSENMENVIKKNYYIEKNHKEICIKIRQILDRSRDILNLKNIDNICIVIDNKCILKMQRRYREPNCKHLVIFLTTVKKDYGYVWSYLGRPIYKRLGWRILD